METGAMKFLGGLDEEEEDVLLLGTRKSPFSNRVELALKLKGIPYEFLEEDLSNKSPLLLTHNPVHKKIPVLLHGGKSVAESLVIVEYIDETWTHDPILPRDPYERSVARFWAKFIDDKCLPALFEALMKRTEGAAEEGRAQLRVLEEEAGKGKRFFGGDEIGLADIAGGFIWYGLGAIEEGLGVPRLLNPEDFPGLWKRAEEYVGHAVVKESLPNREELVAAWRARFAGGLSAGRTAEPKS